MRLQLGAAILAAAALATISCGGITDPSTNQVETFSDKVTPVSLGGTGGGPQHHFNMSNNGEYSIKVTAMTPTFNNFFGVLLTFGSDCSSIVGQNVLSIVGSQALAGAVFQKGAYCVQIYDAQGTMTASENYTLTVSHP
ncbi:MAG TPA: hypothetical protein VFA59_06520 [Vicinamibacterales bacterium]|nr:hypothetical protein [Vicinamibacterales bacterium]